MTKQRKMKVLRCKKVQLENGNFAFEIGMRGSWTNFQIKEFKRQLDHCSKLVIERLTGSKECVKEKKVKFEEQEQKSETK